jgi:hypothetical protein
MKWNSVRAIDNGASATVIDISLLDGVVGYLMKEKKNKLCKLNKLNKQRILTEVILHYLRHYRQHLVNQIQDSRDKYPRL